MSPVLPRIAYSNVTRIFDDGQHNAFTDMIEYRGRFYLGFRAHPRSHDIDTGAHVVILVSDDQGKTWREVARKGVEGRDPRDPHFFILNDKLFACFGSWLPSKEKYSYQLIRDHQGYAITSDDGETWSDPFPLEGTAGHFIWRCATHQGKAYLCGRRINEEKSAKLPPDLPVMESALMQSDDGLSWKTIGLFQEEKGNETGFVIDDDGSITAVARCMPHAQLCKSKPPYDKWERTSLGRFIGGPLITRWHTKWGEMLLVGGRKFLAPDDEKDKQPRTMLSWVVDGKLHDMTILPSGGDNSYTGFIPLSDTQGLVSWYSSHEGSGSKLAPAHIYTATITLE